MGGKHSVVATFVDDGTDKSRKTALYATIKNQLWAKNHTVVKHARVTLFN